MTKSSSIVCGKIMSRRSWRSAPRGSAPRGLCVVSWLPSPCPCGLGLALAFARSFQPAAVGGGKKISQNIDFARFFWASGGGGSGR